ncbi:MAG: diguanylate cyclase [Rhodomicrobium sp.]|nr:diguanylate cyclase [Rhodomicrobium sp.]
METTSASLRNPITDQADLAVNSDDAVSFDQALAAATANVYNEIINDDNVNRVTYNGLLGSVPIHSAQDVERKEIASITIQLNKQLPDSGLPIPAGVGLGLRFPSGFFFLDKSFKSIFDTISNLATAEYQEAGQSIFNGLNFYGEFSVEVLGTNYTLVPQGTVDLFKDGEFVPVGSFQAALEKFGKNPSNRLGQGEFYQTAIRFSLNEEGVWSYNLLSQNYNEPSITRKKEGFYYISEGSYREILPKYPGFGWGPWGLRIYNINTTELPIGVIGTLTDNKFPRNVLDSIQLSVLEALRSAGLPSSIIEWMKNSIKPADLIDLAVMLASATNARIETPDILGVDGKPITISRLLTGRTEFRLPPGFLAPPGTSLMLELSAGVKVVFSLDGKDELRVQYGEEPITILDFGDAYEAVTEVASGVFNLFFSDGNNNELGAVNFGNIDEILALKESGAAELLASSLVNDNADAIAFMRGVLRVYNAEYVDKNTSALLATANNNVAINATAVWYSDDPILGVARTLIWGLYGDDSTGTLNTSLSDISNYIPDINSIGKTIDRMVEENPGVVDDRLLFMVGELLRMGVDLDFGSQVLKDIIARMKWEGWSPNPDIELIRKAYDPSNTERYLFSGSDFNTYVSQNLVAPKNLYKVEFVPDLQTIIDSQIIYNKLPEPVQDTQNVSKEPIIDTAHDIKFPEFTVADAEAATIPGADGTPPEIGVLTPSTPETVQIRLADELSRGPGVASDIGPILETVADILQRFPGKASEIGGWLDSGVTAYEAVQNLVNGLQGEAGPITGLVTADGRVIGVPDNAQLVLSEDGTRVGYVAGGGIAVPLNGSGETIVQVIRGPDALRQSLSGIASLAARGIFGPDLAPVGQVGGIVLTGLNAANRIGDLSKALDLAVAGGNPAISALMDGVLSVAKSVREANERLETQLAKSSNEVDSLRRNIENIQQEAMLDPLTGVKNRKTFDLEMNRLVRDAKDSGQPLALIMADVDHFKKFNDRWGHQTGDHVLRLVADVMNANTKGQDILARYGGEEFAVILPGTSLENAVMLANRIRTSVESRRLKKRRTDEDLGLITLSMGAALLKSGRAVDAEVVFRADLMKNPRSGRSLFGLFQALEAQGKTDEAMLVRQEFEEAWRTAEIEPDLDTM